MGRKTRRVASTAKQNALTKLGMRLRAAREDTGLTQQAVAERLEVTGQTVSNWEAGRHEPSGENMAMLAALYCVHQLELGADAPTVPAGIILRNPNQRVGVDPQLLVEARKQAGLPQSRAADRAGIRVQVLRNYEHGKARPTRATLRRLAIAYGKPASWGDPEPLPGEIAAAELPRMDEALRAYLKVQPDLTGESVGVIADFILFTHQRQLSRDLAGRGHAGGGGNLGKPRAAPVSTPTEK